MVPWSNGKTSLVKLTGPYLPLTVTSATRLNIWTLPASAHMARCVGAPNFQED